MIKITSDIKIILAALLGLFVLLIICFIARGWLRTSVYPGYVSWRYKNSVQSSYDSANKDLGYPFSTIGFTITQRTPGNCSLNTARNIYVEVGCFAGNSGKTGTIDQSYKQKYSTKLAELQVRLASSGWRESQSMESPSTFVGLLNESGQGLGSYHGYIRYDKNIDGNDCWIAISRFEFLAGDLICSRTISIY
jgi:hypothetical protein